MRAVQGWRKRVGDVCRGTGPGLLKKKTFKPKFELPKLASYSEAAAAVFWNAFPKKEIRKGVSLVDAAALRRVAARTGSSDWQRLEKACTDVSEGADIGCAKAFRAASVSGNTKGSYKFGPQVTDEIAGWVAAGFAAGPMDEEEVPAEAKINSILCREKPNGAVRVILNLSAPKGLSVNDGIDASEFPAVMSSTGRWLAVLNEAGHGCKMVKIDWAAAYKHIAVREEDRNLQWFSWLGKYFVELCLVFGGASSAGIYDRLAKTVLDLVIRESGFAADMVCQHLDNVCAAAPGNSTAAEEFDNCYKKIAQEIGVKLAPRDDPDKSFGPSTTGVVFGVRYDTIKWTWGIPEEKLCRLAWQIKKMLGEETVRQDEIQSVVGKIINVKPLVPGGRFNIDHLMRLNNVTEKGEELVSLNNQFKRQLHFWLVMLQACSGWAAIPADAERITGWATECFTDAAGGSLESAGRGVGGVIPSLRWWTFAQWARSINDGSYCYEGKKVARKMSALELAGPLLIMAAAAEQIRGKPVRFWVDNSGACQIWRKGYSLKCKLASTIVKALASIGAALGCAIDIQKVTRCSCQSTEMADALSKADFARFRRCEGGSKFARGPGAVPMALFKWLARPEEDDEVGGKILSELATRMPVMGYNC